MKSNRKYVSVSLLLILLVVSFGTAMMSDNNIKNTNSQNGYLIETSESIDPIEINGNDELASHPRVIGSGTWADPHVIEDFEILGSGSGTGVKISNTNKFLIIQNCMIEDYDYGIYLYNVSNVEIANNTASYNEYDGIVLTESNNNTFIDNTASNNKANGIALFESKNNTLTGNTASNNLRDGIYLYLSKDNTLIDNIFANNKGYGIYLFISDNSKLFNNSMKSDGIVVFGYLATLLSYEINESNKVNGKPIYYYKNQIGLEKSDYTNAGQIFLINCTNSLIAEVNIYDVSIGIFLFYSDNNTLTDNIISYNFHLGIYFHYSDNNTIYKNSFFENTKWSELCDRLCHLCF